MFNLIKYSFSLGLEQLPNTESGQKIMYIYVYVYTETHIKVCIRITIKYCPTFSTAAHKMLILFLVEEVSQFTIVHNFRIFSALVFETIT